MVTPIEAEGNEYYQGRYKEGMIKGPSHERGGVNMLAVEGDFIYPRKYAKQGAALRAEILRIENKMKRLENKLSKSANPQLAENTYKRTFDKVKGELEQLYQTEQALKDQIVAEKEAKEAAELEMQQPEMQEQMMMPQEQMYAGGSYIEPRTGLRGVTQGSNNFDPRFNLRGMYRAQTKFDPVSGLELPYFTEGTSPIDMLPSYIIPFIPSATNQNNATKSVLTGQQVLNDFKAPTQPSVFSKNSYTDPSIDPRTGLRGVVKVPRSSNIDPTTGFKLPYGKSNFSAGQQNNQVSQQSNQDDESQDEQTQQDATKLPGFQVGDIGVGLNSLIPAAYNLYQSMQPTAEYNFGRVRPIDYIPLSPEQALRDQRIATSTMANMTTRMPAGMRSGMLANLQAGALKGMQDTRFGYDQQNMQNLNQVNQANAQIQAQNIQLGMQERQLQDAARAARQQFGATGFSQLGNVFGGVGSAMNQRQQGMDLAQISNTVNRYFDIQMGADGKPQLVMKKKSTVG